MTDIKLLPCPFCGCPAHEYSLDHNSVKGVTYGVECGSCQATIGEYTAPSLAIEAWNQRNQWIACDERLPFNIIDCDSVYVTQLVICATRFGDTFPCEFKGGKSGGEPWHKFDEYEANGKYITHWMPLPKAPTIGGEG